jgi:FAD/FMN-containing dehydrogenase
MILENENTKNKIVDLNNSTIEELRRILNGRVVMPDDASYDEARTVFYGDIDRRPAMIAYPADARDVSRVVTLARETGVELAVRSGGHSNAGHSVSEGGIVLDLKNMRALQIDAEHHSAWAGTGLTAGEYTVAVGKFGLATGFGDTGSVGIGGLTLGGGVGYLLRKHGLTIDSLLAAEVVTADGQLLHVDAETHPDLFWAIRGGGGNFGVATRFQFRLHEVDTIVGGMLILPATPTVITSFIAESVGAPDELSIITNIMPAPPMPFIPEEQHGQLVILATLVYAGTTKTGERAIAPFRKLAQSIADMVRPMRYPEIYPAEEGGYHPLAVGHSMFLNMIDVRRAETIVEFLQSSDAPMRVAQLRVLGGAMANIPDDATAFAHRQQRFMVNLASFYNGAEDKPVREAWLKDFTEAMHQGNAGVYVNFLGDEGERRIREAYPGPTWERLAKIKARYDPTNFFHLNQNIPPASE